MSSFKQLAEDPKVNGVRKMTIFQVSPELLQEEAGFNLRDYDDPDVKEQILGFANAYAAGAFVPPIVARVASDGSIWVVEGHCRRRGALLAIERGAPLKSLEVVPFKGSDTERVEIMLRSAEGLKLKPIEIAFGYLRLLRMGNSNSDIARRVGKSAQHVEQMLLLAQANHDVHMLVRSGKVSATVAIEAIREHREAAGEFLAGKFDEAARRGKSVVTMSTIRDWVPPRKIVKGVLSSIDRVFESLDKTTRVQLAEYESLPAEVLENKTVTINAAAFMDLVKSQAETQRARDAKKEAERDATIQAGQQGLPDFEG